MYVLSNKEFKYISKKVYDYSHINLTEKKKSLMVSRLSKRIRALNLNSFAEYINFLEDDNTGQEFLKMIDSLSTNFTHFFRENHHFDFLSTTILPKSSNSDFKVWSAASSTGQEVFSILMTIMEYEEKTKKYIKPVLYASDISRDVLKTACKGIYPSSELKDIPKTIIKKYFLHGNGRTKNMVKIKKNLISKIKFFRLNLSDHSFNLPKMDVIFLRNVIIYFDSDTKYKLVEKLHRYIKPGGYLIIGHSESLSGLSHIFKLIGKTIYQKI